MDDEIRKPDKKPVTATDPDTGQSHYYDPATGEEINPGDLASKGFEDEKLLPFVDDSTTGDDFFQTDKEHDIGGTEFDPQNLDYPEKNSMADQKNTNDLSDQALNVDLLPENQDKQNRIEDAKRVEEEVRKRAQQEAKKQLEKKAEQEVAKKAGEEIIGDAIGASTSEIWVPVVLGCLIIFAVVAGIIGIGLLAYGISGLKDTKTTASTNGPASSSGVPLYKQWDARWGNLSYGCGGTTIASSGCGITSLAMVISYYAGKEVLPPQTALISMENGWRDCGAGTAWAAMTEMPKIFGLYAKSVTWEQAKTYLKKGMPVIQSHSCCYFTKHGHFIVVTGINSDGTYKINDPDGFHRTEATEDQVSVAKGNWVIWK